MIFAFQHQSNQSCFTWKLILLVNLLSIFEAFLPQNFLTCPWQVYIFCSSSNQPHQQCQKVPCLQVNSLNGLAFQPFLALYQSQKYFPVYLRHQTCLKTKVFLILSGIIYNLFCYSIYEVVGTIALTMIIFHLITTILHLKRKSHVRVRHVYRSEYSSTFLSFLYILFIKLIKFNNIIRLSSMYFHKIRFNLKDICQTFVIVFICSSPFQIALTSISMQNFINSESFALLSAYSIMFHFLSVVVMDFQILYIFLQRRYYMIYLK